MLNQVVQVIYRHWKAFAPCFLGVWRCKNFSSQGLLLGGFCCISLCLDKCRQTLYIVQRADFVRCLSVNLL